VATTTPCAGETSHIDASPPSPHASSAVFTPATSVAASRAQERWEPALEFDCRKRGPVAIAARQLLVRVAASGRRVAKPSIEIGHRPQTAPQRAWIRSLLDSSFPGSLLARGGGQDHHHRSACLYCHGLLSGLPRVGARLCLPGSEKTTLARGCSGAWARSGSVRTSGWEQLGVDLSGDCEGEALAGWPASALQPSTISRPRRSLHGAQLHARERPRLRATRCFVDPYPRQRRRRSS
jgi:hypothetical protein